MESCPTTPNPTQTIKCLPNTAFPECNDISQSSYASLVFLNRFCVPTAQDLLNRVTQAFAGISVNTILQSLEVSIPYILISILFAFVYSFIFSFLLEKFAGVIVTLCIIGFYALSGLICYFCWDKYFELKDSIPTVPPEDKEQTERSALYMQIISIAISVFIFVLLSVTCCLLGQIMLAIKVISAAADFVLEYKSVVTIPLITTVSVLAYTGWWVYWTVLVYSEGTLYRVDNLPFLMIELNENQKRLMYFNLFNLLWVLAFLVTWCYFVVSCSACIWYSNSGKEKMKHPVVRSFRWSIRYHLGSISFGSLILALVWALIIIAEYIIVSSSHFAPF